MTDDTRPTRRGVLRASAAIAAGGALAGCTGASGPSESPGDSADGSYSVTMEPVGTVDFDAVPATWVANNASWADMGVALGREPPAAVWMTSRFHTRYYDDIPGLEVSTDDVVALYQDAVDKERFYQLDADVHVMDPNFLMNRFKGWDDSDVAEVRDNIGPFFGNSIFSTGYPWHEDYPYLSLYEAFGKLAEVFQATDRYDAFVEIHDEFQANVEAVVPADEGDRPAVAIMWAGSEEPEEFSPYLIGEGTSFKQWRDLGVRDALAETDVEDFHRSRGSVDYETLLDIDPDVLLFRGHEAKTADEFRDTVVAYMEDHEVASDLTAVQNGDVYRGGPLYQGPISNLVLTERGARQVYGVDEELFDRQRVADVVAGDF